MLTAGFFLHARPIGGLRMIDGNQADDKIIAVLEDGSGLREDPGRMRDVPQGLIDRLKHYFLSYKQLPSDKDKKVEIVDVYDRTEAQDVIARSLGITRKNLPRIHADKRRSEKVLR